MAYYVMDDYQEDVMNLGMFVVYLLLGMFVDLVVYLLLFHKLKCQKVH